MEQKNKPLFDALQTILKSYQDWGCPQGQLHEYDLIVSGSNIQLVNVGGHKDRFVSGKLSAWILLCGKYWAATHNDDLFSRYGTGEIPSLCLLEDTTPSLSLLKDAKKILEALVAGGNFFLSNNEQEEAEQCFWAALSDATSGENAKSLLESIPEPYRTRLEHVYNDQPVNEKIWNGRSSLSILAGTKGLEPFCHDKDPLSRFEALKFFARGLQLGTASKTSTGKHIHEIFVRSIYPCVNDPCGTVEQKAFECTERWVFWLMNEFESTPYFYEQVLHLIEKLLEYGINHRVHQQYRWETLVGLGRYDQAEANWALIEQIVKEKLGNKKMTLSPRYLNEGDLMEWRMTALTRAAKSILSLKKINPEQLKYTEKLLNEAVAIAEPRVSKHLTREKKLGDLNGFFESTYAAFGMLHEKNRRPKEALKAYEFAKRIESRLGSGYRAAAYDTSIARVKNFVE